MKLGPCASSIAPPPTLLPDESGFFQNKLHVVFNTSVLFNETQIEFLGQTSPTAAACKCRFYTNDPTPSSSCPTYRFQRNGCQIKVHATFTTEEILACFVSYPNQAANEAPPLLTLVKFTAVSTLSSSGTPLPTTTFAPLVLMAPLTSNGTVSPDIVVSPEFLLPILAPAQVDMSTLMAFVNLTTSSEFPVLLSIRENASLPSPTGLVSVNDPNILCGESWQWCVQRWNFRVPLAQCSDTVLPFTMECASNTNQTCNLEENVPLDFSISFANMCPLVLVGNVFSANFSFLNALPFVELGSQVNGRVVLSASVSARVLQLEIHNGNQVSVLQETDFSVRWFHARGG
jgi:hypothetical protein